MLPFHQPGEEDYRGRFKVLEDAGILTRPNRKLGTALTINKDDALRELSFGFFVAWALKGLLPDKVGISLLPFKRESKTLLVIHAKPTRLLTPGPSHDGLEVDDRYLWCPMNDISDGGLPSKIQQVLCPVLNKIRFNLGAGNTPDLYQIPKKSEECCHSRKEALWDYIRDTVLADPYKHGHMLGGTVIPLDIHPDIVARYATGLDPKAGDFGKIIDETLLWFAMGASATSVGIPNCELKKPFKSSEIDFLLYDPGGDRDFKDEPSEGWSAVIARHSMCVFETTVGHIDDGPDSGRSSGNDHPKNKLINFLALQNESFKKLHFHYLTISGFPREGMSESTKQALKGTAGFTYWALCDQFPGADALLTNFPDSPVPISQLRTWHSSMVEKVEEAARKWASK